MIVGKRGLSANYTLGLGSGPRAPTPRPLRGPGARGDQRISWPHPGDPGMGACGMGMGRAPTTHPQGAGDSKQQKG